MNWTKFCTRYPKIKINSGLLPNFCYSQFKLSKKAKAVKCKILPWYNYKQKHMSCSLTRPLFCVWKADILS